MDPRSLKELELLELAKLYGFAQAAAVAPSAPTAPAPMAREAVAPAPPLAITAPMSLPADWDGLRAIVRDCTRCGLCRQRKQAVFGVGAERGPWLFVGEGPGAEEDEQGEPFVGQSGKLLDNMLAAIGLKRGRDAYIANVVKCRPPGNRTPTLEEAAACAPYLDAQIDLLQPKLIVALGKVAAQRLLNTEASLGSQRGNIHAYRGIPVVVTYHPSYLLRTLPEKAKAWEDLLYARRKMLELTPARPHDRGAP